MTQPSLSPTIERLRDPDDVHSYVRVRDLLAYLYPKNQPLALQRFQSVIAGDDVHVYVARLDEDIRGTASLMVVEKLGGIVAIIHDVAVQEAYQKRGLGRALTQALLTDARSIGVPFVDVDTRRPDAREFYLRCGFEDKNDKRPFFSLRYTF